MSFKIINDKRDKIVLHKTTSDVQEQDRDQDQDRIFWSQTGLVLSPTVSDHITGRLLVKRVLNVSAILIRDTLQTTSTFTDAR